MGPGSFLWSLQGALQRALLWGEVPEAAALLSQISQAWEPGLAFLDAPWESLENPEVRELLWALWFVDVPAEYRRRLNLDHPFQQGLAVWQSLLAALLTRRRSPVSLQDWFCDPQSPLIFPPLSPRLSRWLQEIGALWRSRPPLQQVRATLESRLPPDIAPELIDLGLALYLWGDAPQDDRLIEGRARRLLSPRFAFHCGALTGAFFGPQTSNSPLDSALGEFALGFYGLWRGALAAPTGLGAVPLTGATGSIQGRPRLKLISCERVHCQ
ncbi:MAG: hypothetical protein GC158_05230 [Cyanobacteria bacterium RI_101]|nr:hypothetical protein [Cyanobacteria bacterium RI_101]